MAMVRITVELQVRTVGDTIDGTDLQRLLTSDETAMNYHIGGKLLEGVRNLLNDEHSISLEEDSNGFNDPKIEAMHP